MNAPVSRTTKGSVVFLAACLVLVGLPVFPARAAPQDEAPSIQGSGAGECGAAPCREPGQPVVVAVALPLSGPHASVGRSVGEKVFAALGAVEGIKVATFDTAGTVAGSEKAVAEAVRAGAAMLVGGIGDRESAALSAAAATAGILFVTMGRSAMPGATTIQAVASRQTMNLALVDEILRQGPVDCASVIFMDNAFGEAELAAFRWALDKRGIRLAGSSRMHPDGVDEVEYVAGITGQINAKRDSGTCVSEILHLVMDVDDAGRLVDHLWYSGFFDKTSGSVRMTGTGLFNAPGLVAQHGSSLKGLVFVDIEPVTGEGATRADLFGLEAEDFASVAAGVAAVVARQGASGAAPVPPVTNGLTGTLVFKDGAMIGQRTRVWRMTGRGLEYVQPSSPALPGSVAPPAAPGPATTGAQGDPRE